MEGDFELQVAIKGITLSGVAMDGGIRGNLMTTQVAERLGFTQFLCSSEILWLAQGQRIVPLGLLRNVQTQIGERNFELDYLIIESNHFFLYFNFVRQLLVALRIGSLLSSSNPFQNLNRCHLLGHWVPSEFKT